MKPPRLKSDLDKLPTEAKKLLCAMLCEVASDYGFAQIHGLEASEEALWNLVKNGLIKLFLNEDAQGFHVRIWNGHEYVHPGDMSIPSEEELQAWLEKDRIT